MRFQNVYECENLDYERTYDNLSGFLKGVEKTGKGHISFRIPPKKIEVLISPKGKIQVAWESEDEKEKFLPFLKSLLVGSHGQETVLKPLHCNVVNVPYPPPSSFGFAWCKEKFRFSRIVSGFFDWLERRAERQRLESEQEDRRLDESIKEKEAECNAIQELILTREDEFTIEKRAIIERKWRKFYGLDKDLPDNP